MSVMRLSREHFQTVLNKVATYRNVNMMCLEYCSRLYRMDDSDALMFVANLDQLNDLSCYYHGSTWRGNKPNTDYKGVAHDLKIQRDTEVVNAPMMLKLLECIEYNIEIDEIPEEVTDMEMIDAFHTLKQTIDEIKTCIVLSCCPQYANAPWCI